MIDCSRIMRDYSRYLLVVFNFFFVLTGVIIISVGVSAKAYYNEFDHILNDKYLYVSDLLVIIGVIIFFIAFFGCWGAMKENACMTTTFSTLLIIIFVLEGLVGICGVVLKHKTEEFLENSMNASLMRYGNDSEITETWDLMQNQMHCCGIWSYTDWDKDFKNGTLPLSCCKIPAGTSGQFTCTNSTGLYKEGCLQVFGDYVRDNTSSIEIAGLTLATVQLLGIILSCYLAKQIRSDYETV